MSNESRIWKKKKPSSIKCAEAKEFDLKHDERCSRNKKKNWRKHVQEVCKWFAIKCTKRSSNTPIWYLYRKSQCFASFRILFEKKESKTKRWEWSSFFFFRHIAWNESVELSYVPYSFCCCHSWAGSTITIPIPKTVFSYPSVKTTQSNTKTESSNQ